MPGGVAKFVVVDSSGSSVDPLLRDQLCCDQTIKVVNSGSPAEC